MINPFERFKRDVLHDKLEVVEEKRMIYIEMDGHKYISETDYLKVVEENKRLNEIIKSRDTTIDYYLNANKEQVLSFNNEIKTNLTLGKRIKELEEVIEDYNKVILSMKQKEAILEKEIEGMKTLKVCMKCQTQKKETIDKWISKGRYLFIDNCLQEDCEVCEGEDKNKFVEIIEQTNYGFKDSWMLSYKVEGIKEPIVQHHLTKEECEIIYGNMNNITYWFMELMK